MELFAGSKRASAALARHGVPTESWEILDGPGNDFMCKKNRARLRGDILAGKVLLLWAGIPCSSWSRARRNDGRGPGPLRSDGSVYGLPDLRPGDVAKVQEANAMLRHLHSLLHLCMSCKVPFVIENPWTSRIWLTRETLELRERGAELHKFDFCPYKGPWRKRTGLLIWQFPELASALRVCKAVQHRCSATNSRHLILEGTDSNGVFWTRRAQAYPVAFCKEFALLVRASLATVKP